MHWFPSRHEYDALHFQRASRKTRGNWRAAVIALAVISALTLPWEFGPRQPGHGSLNAQESKKINLPKPAVLESTRVVGTPEPPPPYRAQRVLSQFKVNFPIFIERQPASEYTWVIQQQANSSKTSIARFRDGDATGEVEELLKGDDVAYSLVFHPRFRDNGFVYVGANGAYPDATGKPGPKRTRVTRYTVDRTPPHKLDPKSAFVVIDWESDGHNGAAVTFGLDGMLYVTSGDGTSDSDTKLTGQGLDHLLAKVLRIDVDGAAAGQGYRVPADNPFVGREGTRPETWAYGLRNPWRMTTDQRTGHIWVGNNGQDLWEQVYLVRKGDNYGWSVMEGSHPFYLERKAGPDPFVKPTAEHPHSESRSLTGGVVYYGKKHPELSGAYIYGDYATGKIWAIKHNGEKAEWHREIADTSLAISGFGFDQEGELLVCDHRGGAEGGFYALAPQPAASAELTKQFPRKLSETGLFSSVEGHKVRPELIPYSVNSPLWSDGSYKERYIALVGADAKMETPGHRGWNFPNGTVLVKSFAIEAIPENKASRRWIETRLMTRQDNEWVGYSYVWNSDQDEAELVDAAGLDREFGFTIPGGDGRPFTRKQTWHFPSRAECMVCHSRAANYVLGLCTAQMNRDHDYGGEKRNQLEVLAHWGLVKSPWTKPVDQLERLVDPTDALADLEARVRSYLHANCSHCHVEAGGGNAQFQVEYHVGRDKMNLLDVAPLHYAFGIQRPALVASGSPDRSVLLHRVSLRGRGQMPPVASSLVDKEAVELLKHWISSLKPPTP